MAGEVFKDDLFIKSPLIQSSSFKKSFKVLLKLENTQPSGSFKTRGISHHCRLLKERGCQHFVSSSGGNAGLAVAYSGWNFGIKTTVFVPETTPTHVIEKLKEYNADVCVKGSVWDHANQHAMDFVKANKDDHASLVHPFNHPEIWQGHSSLVHELKQDLEEPPSAIILSVGGGGLLCGVIQGLHDIGWTNVPVVTCETYGADCFYKAVEAKQLVTLTSITSIAKTLGALTVAESAFEWTKKHNIIPIRITDNIALDACVRFADHHKIMVEPACGAALAPLYSKILEDLQSTGKITDIRSVVVIVCGGYAVRLQDMLQWQEIVKEKTH